MMTRCKSSPGSIVWLEAGILWVHRPTTRVWVLIAHWRTVALTVIEVFRSARHKSLWHSIHDVAWWIVGSRRNWMVWIWLMMTIHGSDRIINWPSSSSSITLNWWSIVTIHWSEVSIKASFNRWHGYISLWVLTLVMTIFVWQGVEVLLAL